MKSILAAALFGVAFASTAVVSQSATAGENFLADEIRSGQILHPRGVFGAD